MSGYRIKFSGSLTIQSHNEAVTAPKFNGMTIEKAFGLLDCVGVVGANQCLETYETPVVPNGIRRIFRHSTPDSEAQTTAQKGYIG